MQAEVGGSSPPGQPISVEDFTPPPTGFLMTSAATTDRVLTPLEEGWLAGLLEGEGTFGTKPNVVVHMTDRDVVERFMALTGAPTLYPTKQQQPHHKPAWRATVSGEAAVHLMAKIRPLMGVRRQSQIDRAIAAWEARPRRRVIDDEEVRRRRSDGERVADIAASMGFQPESLYRALRRCK